MTSVRSALRAVPMFVFLTVPAFSQASSQAAPVDLKLEPATTGIHWTLNTNTHMVHGTFKLQSGSIHIDPATGEASGRISVDATSGDSGNGARDKRMDDVVLETEKYPTITFRPTRVNGKVDLANAGSVTLDGVMNIHGQDHSTQLTVSFEPKGTDVGTKIHFEVPYVAWGMKDPSIMLFRCDKKVAIDIDATAVSPSNVARIR